jgi:hypothetical protein
MDLSIFDLREREAHDGIPSSSSLSSSDEVLSRRTNDEEAEASLFEFFPDRVLPEPFAEMLVL